MNITGAPSLELHWELYAVEVVVFTTGHYFLANLTACQDSA